MPLSDKYTEWPKNDLEHKKSKALTQQLPPLQNFMGFAPQPAVFELQTIFDIRENDLEH